MPSYEEKQRQHYKEMANDPHLGDCFDQDPTMTPAQRVSETAKLRTEYKGRAEGLEMAPGGGMVNAWVAMDLWDEENKKNHPNR